jgi:hypothetical protein
VTLEQWRASVSPHLNFIEAGAEMAARHASALPLKPTFPTHAQDELAKTRAVLEAALANIIKAQSVYESKPEESHAA